MASLSTSEAGLRRVRFKGLDGQRKSIRLGRLSKQRAETVRSYVGRLEVAQQTGTPIDTDTQKWLARITDELHDKLSHVGLVSEREKAHLGPFIDGIVASRQDLKPNTRRNYQVTRRHLVNYFGEEANLRDISAGHASEWRQSMINAGMGRATLSREVKRARQFFRHAVRLGILSENPFDGLPAPAQVNSAREYFVTQVEVASMLEACPDCEWRLIVALSRYGGLRCPSETLKLRWGDVDWANNKITVRSPKTEHNPGGESRTIPLFTELRPYLEEAFEQAEPGTKYVVTRYRNSNVNLRTHLLRIIERAGLQPWPRLFHNMRASRQTELVEQFPDHVVCAWLGNSQQVARAHYLQVNESHFERASFSGEAAQNRAHTASVQAPNASDKKSKTPVFTDEYEGLLYCTNVPVPPRGVEPLSSD